MNSSYDLVPPNHRSLLMLPADPNGEGQRMMPPSLQPPQGLQRKRLEPMKSRTKTYPIFARSRLLAEDVGVARSGGNNVVLEIIIV